MYCSRFKRSYVHSFRRFFGSDGVPRDGAEGVSEGPERDFPPAGILRVQLGFQFPPDRAADAGIRTELLRVRVRAGGVRQAQGEKAVFPGISEGFRVDEQGGRNESRQADLREGIVPPALGGGLLPDPLADLGSAPGGD